MLTLAGGSATWGMRVTGIEFRRSDGSRFDFLCAHAHRDLHGMHQRLVLQAGQLAAILDHPLRQGLPDLILGTTAINRPID